jgi:ABC-type sulfate transport system substrate-binding protein
VKGKEQTKETSASRDKVREIFVETNEGVNKGWKQEKHKGKKKK